MGMGLFGNSSSCGCSTPEVRVEQRVVYKTAVNPDPKDFEILAFLEHKNHLLIRIKYHGCTNYEGHKILVFEDVSIDELFKQNSIDPHFCDNCKISPIARFRPTAEGHRDAVLFVNARGGK